MSIKWEIKEIDLKAWNDEIETISDAIELISAENRPEALRLRELAKKIRDASYNRA